MHDDDFVVCSEIYVSLKDIGTILPSYQIAWNGVFGSVGGITAVTDYNRRTGQGIACKQVVSFGKLWGRVDNNAVCAAGEHFDAVNDTRKALVGNPYVYIEHLNLKNGFFVKTWYVNERGFGKGWIYSETELGDVFWGEQGSVLFGQVKYASDTGVFLADIFDNIRICADKWEIVVFLVFGYKRKYGISVSSAVHAENRYYACSDFVVKFVERKYRFAVFIDNIVAFNGKDHIVGILEVI